MAEKKTTKKEEKKVVEKKEEKKVVKKVEKKVVKKVEKKAVKKTEKVIEKKEEEKIEPIKIDTTVISAPQLIDDDDFVVNEDDFKDLGDRYFEGTGRRKTSIARVRLYTKGDKEVKVNDVDYKEYFDTPTLQNTVLESLDKMKSLGRFRVVVLVRGGGISSQAESVRHGIARALVVFNPDYRKRLRKAGFLTRDSRMKERKKFGLKRARKAPQWSKR
jgi:small subunit ribosomal protein S9